VELTNDLQVAVARKWLRLQTEAFSIPAAADDETFFFLESRDWE
jgi:hypothetical protein